MELIVHPHLFSCFFVVEKAVYPLDYLVARLSGLGHNVGILTPRRRGESGSPDSARKSLRFAALDSCQALKPGDRFQPFWHTGKGYFNGPLSFPLSTSRGQNTRLKACPKPPNGAQFLVTGAHSAAEQCWERTPVPFPSCSTHADGGELPVGADGGNVVALATWGRQGGT